MSRVSPSTVSLAELAQACRFGRVNDVSPPAARRTGFAELDQALPFGGWPIGALTEIMPSTTGIGELQLTMPALAALSREQRYIAFVAPPYLPYPPALAQQGVMLDRVVLIDRQLIERQSPTASLWATEQMLRCAAFGAVLVWPTAVNDKELRRLQLAAEAGNTLAVLYRPLTAAHSSSPAALRLCLHAAIGALRVEIKKCRGGHAGAVVRCAIAPDTPIDRVA